MESEMGPDADARDAGAPSGVAGSGGAGATDGAPFAPVEPAPPTQTTPAFAPLPPAPPPQPGSPYGYAPYGYPPYSYPPYGYGTPPPTGTNGLAIAALVLGILGFLFLTPLVGLTLGLISLSTVRRTGQKGKGLAISGIVLSSVWIAVFATLITVGVIITPDPARRDANGNVVKKGAVAIFDLRPKDCFTLPAGLLGSTDAKTRTLTVVPCSTPHDSEAFGSFDASDDSFPGLEALKAESVIQCVKILDTYLPDVASLPARSQVQFIYGNQQAWDRGVRKIECFIQFPAATMTASVQRDASSYTADQLRFLHAIQPLGDAVDQLNVTPESAGLDVLRQRATDVANAMQNEITALRASPWPADVQPAIDAMVAQHINAAQLWGQAAGSSDLASYGDAVRKANAAYSMADLKAARAALGLPSIADGADGSDGSTAQTAQTA